MASSFQKILARLEDLDDDIADLCEATKPLTQWSDDDYHEYGRMSEALRDIEVQANRYRQNLSLQRKDPDMFMYGPNMIQRLEAFLELEESVSTLWENYVKPAAQSAYHEFLHEQAVQETARRLEIIQDREALIAAGREATAEEERRRQERLTRAQADVRAAEAVTKAEEAQKKANIEAMVLEEMRIAAWCDHERSFSPSNLFLRGSCYLLLESVCPEDRLRSSKEIDCWPDHVNLSDINTEPLAHLIELITQVLQRPSAAEGGLRTRILREDNRLFMEHFDGYRNATRAFLLAIGFRPHFSSSGYEALSELLASKDHGDTSLRRTLVQFVQLNRVERPNQEGLIWWYLEEPQTNETSLHAFKAWLDRLQLAKQELRRIVRIFRDLISMPRSEDLCKTSNIDDTDKETMIKTSDFITLLIPAWQMLLKPAENTESELIPRLQKLILPRIKEWKSKI